MKHLFLYEEFTDENPLDISDVIISTIPEFINEHTPDAYAINNGRCDRFAQVVIQKMGGDVYDFFYELSCEDFINEDTDVWSKKTLVSYGSPFPKGVNGRNFNPGGHVWIYRDGIHYDAECPAGVVSIFDLPIFKRTVHKMRTGEWIRDI